MKSEGPSWDLISGSQYFISPETLPPRIEWRVTGGSEVRSVVWLPGLWLVADLLRELER